MRVKFGMEEASPPCQMRAGEGREETKERREGGEVERLYAKFYLNVFIVSASGGQKATIFGKF